MIARNLARRLERLEAELTPPSDPRVLKIRVTSVGEPDEIIELRLPEPYGRRRSWPPHAERRNR